MENTPAPIPGQVSSEQISQLCPQCHQPVTATEYFCPNCGKNLHEAPLPTTAAAQATLYVFSIILPMICFLFAGRWKGIKYVKSHDPKAKMMGYISIALIIISTGIIMWLAITWTNQYIQDQINSLNLSGLT